ncbi:hypothetical protein L1987_69468 [Smallanthus sonchifolius]|uniref:Uncharacterized protein n=1 Tax=Smallanthus sonchifolius TaxID=185202 RepID=A0ACB9B5I9_9ASTR|nr:hypothetical protein L1987_69468 [Smallanthus sonchifolius]
MDSGDYLRPHPKGIHLFPLHLIRSLSLISLFSAQKSDDYRHPSCIDETTTKTISSSSSDHPRRTNFTPDLEFALGFLPFYVALEKGLQDDEIELLLVKGEKKP